MSISVQDLIERLEQFPLASRVNTKSELEDVLIIEDEITGETKELDFDAKI